MPGAQDFLFLLHTHRSNITPSARPQKSKMAAIKRKIKPANTKPSSQVSPRRVSPVVHEPPSSRVKKGVSSPFGETPEPTSPKKTKKRSPRTHKKKQRVIESSDDQSSQRTEPISDEETLPPQKKRRRTEEEEEKKSTTKSRLIESSPDDITERRTRATILHETGRSLSFSLSEEELEGLEKWAGEGTIARCCG